MKIYYFQCSETLYSDSEYVRVALEFKQDKGYYICTEAVHIDTSFGSNFSKTYSAEYYNDYYDGHYTVIDCSRRSKKGLQRLKLFFLRKLKKLQNSG